jgi:hypothetical protein
MYRLILQETEINNSVEMLSLTLFVQDHPKNFFPDLFEDKLPPDPAFGWAGRIEGPGHEPGPDDGFGGGQGGGYDSRVGAHESQGGQERLSTPPLLPLGRQNFAYVTHTVR